jgi:hypothetical protein
MERHARVHESLREIVPILKRHPELKDMPEWVIEDAILKGFWKALVEFVNSP